MGEDKDIKKKAKYYLRKRFPEEPSEAIFEYLKNVKSRKRFGW